MIFSVTGRRALLTALIDRKRASRDSNPRLPPSQGGTLSAELQARKVGVAGFEPARLIRPAGFEPAVYSVPPHTDNSRPGIRTLTEPRLGRRPLPIGIDGLVVSPEGVEPSIPKALVSKTSTYTNSATVT